MKVYLAGYVGETEYRKFVKEHYGDKIIAFDPISEVSAEITAKVKLGNCQNLTFEDKSNIVCSDKEEIEDSDILVAYIQRYSAGTSMEILYAYMLNIPVYLICPDKSFQNDIWLSYHATKIFSSVEECFEEIIGLGPKLGRKSFSLGK